MTMPSTDRAAVLEEVCLVEGDVTVRTRTKQSKVARGFSDARGKAGHVVVSAFRVAYLRDVGDRARACSRPTADVRHAIELSCSCGLQPSCSPRST